MWTGLLAGVGALSSIVANRLATEIWVRVFKAVSYTHLTLPTTPYV